MPQFKAESALVVVDVVVTDKAGNVVRSLQKKDFTVTENGEPQQIRSFSFENAVSQPPSSNVAEGTVKAEYSNTATANSANATMTFILVDTINTDFQDQVYARRAIKQYLQAAKTTPGKLFLLESGERLQLVTEIEDEVMDQDQKDAKIAGALKQLDRDRSIGTSAADNPERRLQRSLVALQMIARATKEHPARKNVVWISAGLPPSFTADRDTAVLKYREMLRQTAALLSEARVAVYPVDPSGFMSVERTNTDPDVAVIASNDEFGIANSRAVMRDLARDTGGKACSGRNDLNACIAEAVEDGSSYYVLAYRPQERDYKRQFKKIEVKVKGSQLNVRNRGGYYSAASQPEAALQRALEMDMSFALWNPLQSAGVRLAAHVNWINAQEALVHVDVDPGSVSFIEPEAGKRKTMMQMELAQFSRKGALLKTVAKSFSTPFGESEMRRVSARGLPLEIQEKLNEAVARLRVIVRDETTGRVGTLDVPVPKGLPNPSNHSH